MSSVTWTTQSEDGLQQVTWRFFRLGAQPVVDQYIEASRESKRHRFQPKREWRRLGGWKGGARMQQDEVPFTPAIAEQAKQAYLNELSRTLTVGFQR